MSILKTTMASLVVATTLLPVLASTADARQSTTNMSCSQAQNLVNSRGGVVLNTGRNTFDRFVANRTFCPPSDYIKRAWVPTKDKNSCFIGYICTMDNPWDPWND